MHSERLRYTRRWVWNSSDQVIVYRDGQGVPWYHFRERVSHVYVIRIASPVRS